MRGSWLIQGRDSCAAVMSGIFCFVLLRGKRSCFITVTYMYRRMFDYEDAKKFILVLILIVYGIINVRSLSTSKTLQKSVLYQFYFSERFLSPRFNAGNILYFFDISFKEKIQIPL